MMYAYACLISLALCVSDLAKPGLACSKMSFGNPRHIEGHTNPALVCLDSLPLDTFTLHNLPGIAAMTIGKNQLELNLYSTFSINQQLYNFFNAAPSLTEDRQDALSTLLQVTYGTSRHRNLNIGLDASFSRLFYKPAAFPDQSYSIARAGPRVRWRPFGSLGDGYDLVVQHAAAFILSDSKDLLQPDWEFSNQLFLFKYLLRQRMVLQVSTGLSVNARSSNTAFDPKRPLLVPAIMFWGFYPRQDLIFFSFLSYFAELGTLPGNFSEAYTLRRDALNLGFGGQMTFNYRFAIYLIPQLYLNGKNGGGANQIIAGVRFLY